MKGAPVGTRPRNRMARAGVGSAVAALALASAQQAAGSEILVTRRAASGHGTFSAAVRKANANRDLDTIHFSRRIDGSVLVREDLTFAHPTAIKGERGRNGALVPRLKGRGKTLHFSEGGLLRDLKLDRLAVATTAGRLRIVDSKLTGRGEMHGAGVEAEGYGDTTVRVSGTRIMGFGVGLNSYGADVRINGSTISGNGAGGGVASSGYGSLRMKDTTVVGNWGELGGVRGYLPAHTQILDSTISNNTGEGEDALGGGVSGEVTISQATITGNTALGDGAGGVSSGGYDVEITNSIVAGNFAHDPAEGDDCSHPNPDGRSVFGSGGGNLIGSPGTCEFGPDDLIGADPLLGPLADNGGPTRTHAIRARSPAVGLAVKESATMRDQRHALRDRHPDSGAFEAGAEAPG